jgi:glucosamine--fructose-6-phosphate aminotransferase (isomerizing)
VAARDSPVIGVGCSGDMDLERVSEMLVPIPCVSPLFSPIPVTIVLQLLAYHTARIRGCTIDKPKNLAKSVTVE